MKTGTEKVLLNNESVKVRVICSSCGSAVDCQCSGLRVVAVCVSAKMSCSLEAPECCPVGFS